jgi:hypothetical protein
MNKPLSMENLLELSRWMYNDDLNQAYSNYQRGSARGQASSKFNNAFGSYLGDEWKKAHDKKESDQFRANMSFLTSPLK